MNTTDGLMRIIMLIDMDAFYVACEELRHPEIRDVPAIVGFDPKEGKGRGVVMTCNYKAREFGIRSGTPISIAYKLKPDAVFLPIDYDYYETISKKVMDAIKNFADKFEQVSVDEAYIDVSKKITDYEAAERYAQEIRKVVLEKIGLKCSIGIGPNKLIAKMACEHAKPNGVKVVKDADVNSFLSSLAVGELYGVGTKTKERLEQMGYKTVGDLAKAKTMNMVDKFGVFGRELVNSANGIDEREVTENYDVLSISKELTFQSDTDKDEDVKKAIADLGAGVVAELKKKQENFRTVTLKLRYGDFSEHIHSRSIRITDDPDALVDTAVDLYMHNVDRNKKVRKLGVRASNLVSYKGQKKIM